MNGPLCPLIETLMLVKGYTLSPQANHLFQSITRQGLEMLCSFYPIIDPAGPDDKP